MTRTIVEPGSREVYPVMRSGRSRKTLACFIMSSGVAAGALTDFVVFRTTLICVRCRTLVFGRVTEMRRFLIWPVVSEGSGSTRAT